MLGARRAAAATVALMCAACASGPESRAAYPTRARGPTGEVVIEFAPRAYYAEVFVDGHSVSWIVEADGLAALRVTGVPAGRRMVHVITLGQLDCAVVDVPAEGSAMARLAGDRTGDEPPCPMARPGRALR